jgi:Na+/proline symporter
LVYIGGLAAATSMVIVAAIVLSTMLTTEILNPLILKRNALSATNSPTTKPANTRFSSSSNTTMSGQLLNLRRFSIAIILLLALLFDFSFNQKSELASLGLLSFILLAQAAPAVIAALYWRNASSKGIMWGLIVGCLVWTYTLLLPTVAPNKRVYLGYTI